MHLGCSPHAYLRDPVSRSCALTFDNGVSVTNKSSDFAFYKNTHFFPFLVIFYYVHRPEPSFSRLQEFLVLLFFFPTLLKTGTVNIA